MTSVPRLATVCAVLGTLAPIHSASAANAAKPRVPVNWTPGACAPVVDQSTDPAVHFAYTVPSEEDPDDRTFDEVDDSRTHQFFAFAAQDYAPMPTWITHADIMRASLVDPEVQDAEVDPEDVLEDTSRFGPGKWLRITPDDARVPIDDAQAAMGVRWDTAGVPPGTYVIYGFTWEPVANLWQRRPGFVKVIPSAAEAALAGPSIAIDGGEAILVAGTPYILPGCADVTPGTTVSVQWGESIGTLEPQWQTIAEQIAVGTGPLSVEFVPPDVDGVTSIRVRLVATDADGRTYTAYAPTVLSVMPDPDPDSDPEGGCAVTAGGAGLAHAALLLFVVARRRRRVVHAFAAALLGGCGDDAPADTAGTGATDTSGADGTDTSDTGFVLPTEGPLGCPANEACTLVVVAQAFDDRLEIFAPRGPGPSYRGAIDLDLKPNLMGDNSGDLLDEPYGITIDAAGLSVLVGHYPARDRGSLVVFPHEFLAAQPAGATVPQTAFFDGAMFLPPVRAIDLAAEEAIFILTHPSGRQLVGVFANDLFTPEFEWTAAGELFVVDPVTGEVGRRSLGAIGAGDGAGSCVGAWSLVALDAAMDRVALACDGDEGAVVLDTSAVGEGTVAEAAAAIDGCVANLPFPDKRVRSIAPDGLGGFVLAENPPIATFDPGRLWRFDGACNPLGVPGEIPGELWEVRDIVALPSDVGARWLMATGRTDGRGVHVVRDGEVGAEICATLDDLDPWWTGSDGSDVHPHALALDRRGTAVAIGAGPPDAADAAAGYGRVLWVELEPGDPCESSPVGTVVDLVDAAPPVADDDPSTWRRAPNVVVVTEQG